MGTSKIDHKVYCLIAMVLILGTWASQAMSRELNEVVSMTVVHEEWMVQHGRVYADNAEKEKRFQIFQQNMDYINKFNNNPAGINRTYKLSTNKFSDLTLEEFLSHFTGYKMPSHKNLSSSRVNSSFKYADVTETPTSLDWRQMGAVTPIKDQGTCGCCWAFSSVAAIEGITQIKTGKLVSLSEQQLLDCTASNYGCNGGYMDNAFKYIIQNQGITSEANYPYQQTQGTCNTELTNNNNIVAKITGYEDVPQNDEEALLKAVSAQPVSVGIAVNQEFKNYGVGVFSTDQCGTSISHAVTIVGYGIDEVGTKYWLVKNSWGESWGENGYMKIQRDSGIQGGICLIASMASYPLYG